METIWLPPALICYALSAAGFVAGRAANRPRWIDQAVPLLGVAVLFHTMDLLVGASNEGNIPVTNFAQSLSFLAWLTAIVSFVLILRMRMQVLGAFVAPGVLAAAGAAMLLSRRGRLVIPDSLRSAWLPVHVTLAFLGDALFVVAAGVSLAYLVYESRLKAKRPMTGAGQPMPSLEKLDRINYRLLGWGFVMLSLAILSGALWAEATWGHFWSWEPQESWSLITWILYAALLESRIAAGWRGRRAAALTLAAFTVLLGSFLSVSLLFPGKHGGSFG
jgi:cytochrome c-type biogenesis protein CcsB